MTTKESIAPEASITKTGAGHVPAIAHPDPKIIPPLMVNEDTARATGQLPDKEGQMYHVTKDELYLIPTAEVPITNIFRDYRR